MKKKIFFIIIIIIAALLGGFFYFRYQVYYSHGEIREDKIFEIFEKEGSGSIGERLEKEKIISSRLYFYYYLWLSGLKGKILPGKYKLSGQMSVPEIALIVTREENILPGYVKITFPEGWGSKKMAERLSANGLDGEGFLKIVQNPQTIKERYEFLKGKNITSLEGYLFPDTYFFSKESDAQSIVLKMLGNFGKKFTPEMQLDIKKQGRSTQDVVTMASISEKEVQSNEDREIVSGIFWNRIKVGQALQSCATLAYVLGVNKKQYSLEDTRVDSPFNTYRYKGLPPAPIGNPGISALRAAIYPKETEYNYFLSDPETGKTVFAKTYAEQVANKAKYGL